MSRWHPTATQRSGVLDGPAIVHPIEAAHLGMGGLWRRVWDAVRRAPLARLALAMVAADVFFIVVQVAVDAPSFGFQGSFRLSLETEGGISQTYGWGKAMGAAVFLGWSARRLSLLMVPPAGLCVLSAVILDALSVTIALEDGGELGAPTVLLLLAAVWLRGADEVPAAEQTPG